MNNKKSDQYVIQIAIEKHCSFFSSFDIPKDLDHITYGEDIPQTHFFFKTEDDFFKFKTFFESKGFLFAGPKDGLQINKVF